MRGKGNVKRLRSDVDSDDKCHKCSFEIMEESAQCYSCSEWFHGHCVGLSKEQVDSLDKMSDNVEIICKTCKKNKDRINLDFEKLKETNEMLMQRNRALESDN